MERRNQNRPSLAIEPLERLRMLSRAPASGEFKITSNGTSAVRVRCEARDELPKQQL
jgi:hypothetical protein